MLHCLIFKPKPNRIEELLLQDFLCERMKAVFKLEVHNLCAKAISLSVSENLGTGPLGDVLLRKSLQEDSLFLAPTFQRGQAKSSHGLHPPLQDYCWMHLANLRSQDK